MKRRIRDLMLLETLPAGERQWQIIRNGLCTLTTALWEYFGHWVMVLWDDYDVPLIEAEANDYYPKMQSVMREIFSRGIKDSEAVGKAVMTGSSVTAECFDDIVGDFSCSMLERPYLWDAVGFTAKETTKILGQFGKEDCRKDIIDSSEVLYFDNEAVYSARAVLRICAAAGSR